MANKTNEKMGSSTKQHGSTTNAKPKNKGRSRTGKGIAQRPFK